MQPATLERLAIIIAIWSVLSCSVAVAQTDKPSARLFDEFGDIQASDLIARLDNLAVHLQEEPNVKGFVVVYRTRRDLPGLSHRYARRIRSYLVETRGVPAERIVTVDGGEAACLTQELWIVPPDTAPKPRADAYERSYRPAVYKFDEHGFSSESETYWHDSLEDSLGAFALELQKYPKSVGYLVGYRGRSGSARRNIQGSLRRERDFLTKEFRIKPDRIRTINGGFREWPTMELWITQERGAVPIITSYRYSSDRRKD